MKRLKVQAPTLKLVSRRVASVFEMPREELESGGVDFAIGPFPQPQPPNSNISDQRIYSEEVVCILRATHPLARRKLTLDVFAKAEHVVVHYPGKGSGLIDRLLEQHNKKRRVAVVVPHFFSAACMVANSDYIATVPSSLARFLAKPLNLSVVKLPVAAPRLLIGMFWHRRNSADRASLWVREIIADTARESGLDETNQAPANARSSIRRRISRVLPRANDAP
jgi:DNA-binding transcriptional LysR family regulator